MLDAPAARTEAPLKAKPDRPHARVPTVHSEAGSPNGTAVLSMLRRRMPLLFASIVLVPLLTYIAVGQLTPLYSATGTLLYDDSGYKAQELQSILQVDPITDAVMVTQAEVLRGMPIVEQVASRLNLYANPEFNASLRPASWWRRSLSGMTHMFRRTPVPVAETSGPQLDPIRNETLNAARGALTVTPVKASHVLEVSFTATDPVLAAAAVNDAMDVYVKARLSAKYGAVMRARDWLERRAAELRIEVQTREDRCCALPCTAWPRRRHARRNGRRTDQSADREPDARPRRPGRDRRPARRSQWPRRCRGPGCDRAISRAIARPAGSIGGGTADDARAARPQSPGRTRHPHATRRGGQRRRRRDQPGCRGHGGGRSRGPRSCGNTATKSGRRAVDRPEGFYSRRFH